MLRFWTSPGRAISCFSARSSAISLRSEFFVLSLCDTSI
jgi:hypothetical protein